MPTDQAPTQVNEPDGPAGITPGPGEPVSGVPALSQEPREPEPVSPVVRGSRWVDYDTHELLQMITELEDERRWARLREGIWLAILIHLIVLSRDHLDSQVHLQSAAGGRFDSSDQAAQGIHLS